MFALESHLNVKLIEPLKIAITEGLNSKALEQGHKILSRLGEAIPSNPTQEALEQHIEQTQSLIRGVSENDILNCRLMTDNIKLAAMKFLAQLESVTIMVEPALHPFVTLKMFFGLSPVSPIGFVYFGSLLAKRGNIRVGLRFTLLAKALLNKLEASEIAGEVICVATEVLCFVEPVQSSRELLLIQGESAAMAGGDIHSACMNRLQYCSMMFWTYSELSVVDDTFSEACRFMRENQHRTTLFFILMWQKTILTLKGSEPEASELSRNIHESNNPHNDGMLKEYAETFFKLNKSSWFLHFGEAGQALILGLVSFELYRATQDSLWLERGKKYSSDMKLWATQGSIWNFQHKQLLLEAEEHYSIGRFEDAQLSYKNAITFARSHKFVNDEALACELAAKFYWGTSSLVSSLEHFRLAHEKYIQWGALSKAGRLFASINQKFSNVLDDNSALLSRIVSESVVVNSQSSDETGPPKRRMV
ncbi:hypothetical protein HJC23_005579 [Cyclotella cryptica]|uniref:Uncharacterized protein n=1 Tax=Cyclotella cryptica TaxID=29204 RepID=A0ABD3PQW5_9STRA